MKLTPFRTTVLTATAIAAVLTTPALAQTSSADTDPADIVVTARRVEEKLQDVPISITVYSQAQLDSKNIVNAADLGNYTPSLSTNSKYGAEKASFVIRGFVQDLATQPSVGVYFADVVGPRSGGSTPSGNGVGIGNLWDLQNVQVLKGPQGTLFGRNTTGGAVLLVPKKPTDKLEGYVEGSYGSYDLKRVQAVVNVPLSDTFKVRAGIDRMTRDGYLHNLSGVGPSRLGNINFWSGRLSIVANLTPDLENYTIFAYTRSDNDNITPKLLGCRPTAAAATYSACQAQLGRDKGWWDVESHEHDPLTLNRTMQVINTTTWQASDTLTIKNIASYAEFYEDTRFSFEGENFITPTGALPIAYIRLINTPGFDNSSQATYTEELQFQGRTQDGKFNWQVGGYFENSDPIGFTSQTTNQLMNCSGAYGALSDYLNGRTRTVNCPPSTSGSLSVPFQKTWFRNRGVYAQATYNLTEKLALTGGIRYTWDKMTHRYDGTNVRFPATGGNTFGCSNAVRVTNPDGSAVAIPGLADHGRCNVTFTAKSSKPTWLIDLDYKPNQDLLLYAKWARGYRAGGVAAANVLFETWKPESIDTYEGGAKATFRGSSVRGYFNVAGFYNDFRNQQIAASLNRNPRVGNPFIGGTAIVNAGKSRIWGAEIDSSLTLFDQFRIDAGYTYLNTKVLSITLPPIPTAAQQFFIGYNPSAVQGGALALSPKNRFSLSGTYMVPLHDDKIGKVSFGATWVHTDSYVLSLGTDPAFQRSPATDLVSVNADWKDVLGTPIDLGFFMTNVTNEKTFYGVSNAWNSFGFESGIVNEPRMYGARLRYTFGR